MWIDSHCHLDFPDFAPDLDGVRARAREAGIGMMLTINTHISRFEGVLAVARACPEVYCTVGIHPHEAASEEVSADRLVALARDPKVVAFGETGLDYYYEHAPRAEQRAGFRRHLAAARAAGLPVIVHTRDADDETREILEEEYEKGPFTGLIHCFSASQSFADAALALGFYISFSGILTFPKAEAVRAVAATIPLDRLLVETDAPFLAPVPHRGKRNEPAFVAHTARRLAELRGLSDAALAEATTANFFRLFTKVPPCG